MKHNRIFVSTVVGLLCLPALFFTSCKEAKKQTDTPAQEQTQEQSQTQSPFEPRFSVKQADVSIIQENSEDLVQPN